MEPIKVGVIGAGTWGTLHAQVYSTTSGIRLVGVCDTNLERARKLAEVTGAEAAYQDWHELLEIEDLQAISLVTPDFAHTEIALAALEAHKDVLIEKPLATTVRECVEMLEAAQRNGVRLMVDFHNRWSPPFCRLEQAVRSGALGKPRHVEFRLNDTIFVPTEYLSWADKSSVLWFLGPHVVDTLRWVLKDEVERVFAVKGEGLLKAKGVDTPDFYKYLLIFRKGTVASVENSWILPESERNIFNLKCAVVGEKGSFYINPSDSTLAELYTETEASCPELIGNVEIHGRREGFMLASIRHFAECLVEHKEPEVSAKDGLEATRVLEAVVESAETGLPVALKASGG